MSDHPEDTGTAIQPDEVSLQLPDGTDPEHLDRLLQELAVHVVELSERLQRLRTGNGSRSDLQAARQICQDLEPTASAAQIAGIINLVGPLDAILQRLIGQRQLPDSSQAKLLLDAADCLEGMYEALQGLRRPPEQASDVLRQLRDWLDSSSTPGDAPHASDSASTDAPPSGASLDTLIELVGQHTTLAARLQTLIDRLSESGSPETAEHSRSLVQLSESLHRLIDQYRQLNRDTERAVLNITARPLATLVPALQQALREAEQRLGKHADLQVEGADVLLDIALLQALEAPLAQLILNALEHGIETATERSAAGKPVTGRILLQARQRGSTVVLACQDDGQGLQWDAIRIAAELADLIDPSQALDNQALARLILEPGLSTLARGDRSSRGFGLGRVQDQIRQSNGLLNIDSAAQAGCRIELHIPLRRVTTNLLIVQSGEDRFAIHEHGLLELVPPDAGQLLGTDRKQLGYRLRGENHPAHQLETLLQRAPSSTAPPLDQCPALLLQGNDGQRRIILVESINDSLDLMVQPAGHYLPSMPGLLGLARLDNDQFIPVLDLAGLFVADSTRSIRLPAGRKVLIVDDSPSVVRSLRQILESAGLEVSSAGDGLEAIANLEQAIPDSLLIDLEMPRMDGLTLLRQVRSQPATRDLPVIVITARGTPEQLREAEQLGITGYLVKPVADAELLRQLHHALGG